MDLIRAMRVFRRVVELRQLTAAAREEGRSTASVSKEIADLEAHLRTKLLHRTTRRVSPTSAGAEYYARCVRILEEIDDVEGALAPSSSPAGTLRMNVPMSFGLSQIGPLLPAMLERWPALRLDVSFTDRFVDVVEDRADLVIRIARALPDSSTLVAQKLARARIVLCASPGYLARCGAPRTVDEIADHECILYGAAADAGIWSLGPSEDERVRVRGRLRVDSSLVLRDALLAGVGLALLPSFYVTEDLASGRLRTLLDERRPPPAIVYALHARGKHVAARVKPIVELLRERFARAEWAMR